MDLSETAKTEQSRQDAILSELEKRAKVRARVHPNGAALSALSVCRCREAAQFMLMSLSCFDVLFLLLGLRREK